MKGCPGRAAFFIAYHFSIVYLCQLIIFHPMLLPSAYFPPIGWMALAVRYPEIILEKHETFPKQTLRNRCQIQSANGLLNLSIPVIRTFGNHTKTGEITLIENNIWQKQHLRAIFSAYRKSPFFDFYEENFVSFFNQKYHRLIDVNESSIKLIIKLLKVNIELIYSEEWKLAAGVDDFRHYFNKPQRVAIGQDKYIQVFSDRFPFMGNLSIIDLLFNLGPASLPYLKSVSIPIIQDKQF